MVEIRRGGRTLRSTALREAASLAKTGIVEQVPGQRGRSSGARVVAALVEADRVGVVRVREPQRRGVAIHLADEAPLRAGGGKGEVVGGVVAAAQDQAVEQIANADPLPRPEPEQGLAVFGAVGSCADDPVERQLMQSHVSGHQLGRAGDRQLTGSSVGGEHFAGAGVDQGPGAGLELRRLRRSDGSPGDQRSGDQPGEEEAPPHRSFSFSPEIRIWGSTPGFSSRMTATGTPVSWAIEVSVSPLCTS